MTPIVNKPKPPKKPTPVIGKWHWPELISVGVLFTLIVVGLVAIGIVINAAHQPGTDMSKYPGVKDNWSHKYQP